MALTSGFLLALSVTIYLIAFILLLAKWERIIHRSMRAFTVLIVNILLLLSIGLYINDSYGFYSSWKELVGISDQSKVAVKPSEIDLSKGKVNLDGSVMIEEKFTGAISKITSSVWFLIPKSIVDSIKANDPKEYPVVMFMSGSPGVPTAWLNGLKLDQQIQNAKLGAPIKDFISVIPDYNIKPHVDTGCMNIPGDVQVESWLTKDVYSYVTNNLPAMPGNWMITGYSTGGWCSAMLAMKHPEIFNAVAPIAGYFAPEPPYELTSTERARLRSEYDLIKLSKLRNRPLELFLITSRQDLASYRSTNWFYNRIGASHNVELLTLQNGGHNFTTWRPIIQDVLKWYSQI